LNISTHFLQCLYFAEYKQDEIKITLTEITQTYAIFDLKNSADLEFVSKSAENI